LWWLRELPLCSGRVFIMGWLHGKCYVFYKKKKDKRNKYEDKLGLKKIATVLRQ
jgi:hypothetical protein